MRHGGSRLHDGASVDSAEAPYRTNVQMRGGDAGRAIIAPRRRSTSPNDLGCERHPPAPQVGEERWPRVSIIVPTFNEEANLPSVLPRIPSWVHEVVLVDGGSTDRTVATARRLRSDVVIVRQRGRGKGNALISGVAAATGDVVVTLDADGSADPAELPAFVGALLSGADLAKGSRFMQGGGTADMEWHRQVGNGALRLVTRLLFGGQFSDLCYGYNALWRTAFDRLELDCDGFEVETLIALRALQADLQITEVASFEAPRINGDSHLRTFRDGCRVLRTILAERCSRRRRRRRRAIRGTGRRGSALVVAPPARTRPVTGVALGGA